MSGPTTPPTRPAAPPGRQRPIDVLTEEVKRLRFWTYFGAAVGVAASVLALIALVAALTSGDEDNTTRPALSELRGDISELRSDVSQSRSAARDAADQTETLSGRVRKL